MIMSSGEKHITCPALASAYEAYYTARLNGNYDLSFGE
jgi:hypothetical protein